MRFSTLTPESISRLVASDRLPASGNLPLLLALGALGVRCVEDLAWAAGADDTDPAHARCLVDAADWNALVHSESALKDKFLRTTLAKIARERERMQASAPASAFASASAASTAPRARAPRRTIAPTLVAPPRSTQQRVDALRLSSFLSRAAPAPALAFALPPAAAEGEGAPAPPSPAKRPRRGDAPSDREKGDRCDRPLLVQLAQFPLSFLQSKRVPAACVDPPPLPRSGLRNFLLVDLVRDYLSCRARLIRSITRSWLLARPQVIAAVLAHVRSMDAASASPFFPTLATDAPREGDACLERLATARADHSTPLDARAEESVSHEFVCEWLSFPRLALACSSSASLAPTLQTLEEHAASANKIGKQALYACSFLDELATSFDNDQAFLTQASGVDASDRTHALQFTKHNWPLVWECPLMRLLRSVLQTPPQHTV